jgi:hypothetical protein
MSDSPQQNFFGLLRAWSGQSQIIAVPRVLINFFDGKLDWAAMTSQLMFHSDKDLTDDGFFCLPDKDLTKEIGISQWQATACRKWLKQHEVIETVVRRVNGTPMLHYRMNDDGLARLVALLQQFIEEGTTAEPQPRSDPYFENVATVCGIKPESGDWSEMTDDERGMCNRAAGQLRKKQEPPELILLFGDYFAAMDFRGKRGEKPKPPYITQQWGLMKKWYTGRDGSTRAAVRNPGLAAVALLDKKG